jgi:CubicO group peptidase (beta-lactamase class C family)
MSTQRVPYGLEAAALCAFLLGPFNVQAAEHNAPNEARDGRVAWMLHAEMAERRIPGVQYVVVQRGRIISSGAYGTANLNDKVPVSAETVFPINSCSKAFAGVALMQLVEDGRVRLTDTVGQYLLDVPDAWRSVTLLQLVTDVSGIPDFTQFASAQTGTGTTDEQAFELVKKKPLLFAPGERFDYSQTNYLLLSKIVAKVTGESFLRFVAERQFVPTGMISTRYADSSDVVPHMAVTYHNVYASAADPGTVKVRYVEFSELHKPSAGIVSTATDIGRWIVALESGRLLRSTPLADLWTARLLNDGHPGVFGLGWRPVVQRAQHPAYGGTGGGRAAFYVYPEDDTSVVILTNLQGGFPEDMMDELAAVFVPGMRLEGVEALRARLLGRSYADLQHTVVDLRKQDPQFQLTEGDVNAWGYRLLGGGEPKASLEVFRLNVRLFPDNGNVYDSLAEAYAYNGEKALAVESYRRSLELDPKNTNAAEMLNKLEKREQ